MLGWIRSEKSPFREHYVIEEKGGKREVLAAITWEIYDYDFSQRSFIAKIKWLFVTRGFRGNKAGQELLLESFKKFNDSWGGKVVAIRVAPYEEKSGLELWYKKVLDKLPGPEAKITLIPNLFGEGQGENIVVKRLTK